MDSGLSKNCSTENSSVPSVSENTRKRKCTEADISAANNVTDNCHSSNKKFSESLHSTCVMKNSKKNNEKQVHATSNSDVNQCSQILNSSQVPNQNSCQTENDKRVANHTLNSFSVERNSNQSVEQNINCNRSRIQPASTDAPVWLNNLSNSPRMLLNWHPFHHRLYIRQQLEMERRRVSLLKNSRNVLDFSHMFIGQIGRGIIPPQTDEKALKLKKIITANTRLLSSGETLNLEEATCVICFMKFKEQQLIRELSCLHRFHKDCIDKWLVNQMNCPICRLPLNENSVTLNDQFSLNSQASSASVNNQHYQSKEINNSLNINENTDSAIAETRGFENNVAMPQENDMGSATGSIPDINNGCTQNFLHCNQSEDTRQSQETTDDMGESPTVQVMC